MDNSENEQIIRGDLFSGVAVSELEDRDYHFTVDGSEVTLSQRVQSPKDDRKVLGFLFLMDKPARFRLDILVPADCKNAQFSLNDKELLGFFSKDIPEDPEYVQVTHCNDEAKYTPLRPGEFQSLNFRWESGDVLKCFFYY
ncbi:MAG: hypothetical protein J5607_11245 [Clostridiales bacterium]|nr:hypothetical protein [Clostridiales bacterium]MBR4818689.1 hypothetical protein [Clostridiales bacterium]